LAIRPIALGLGKLFMLCFSQLSLVSAAPTSHSFARRGHSDEVKALSTDDPSLWLYLGVAAALVLTGGAFAGLTIALMGQVRSILLSQHSLSGNARS
jgi:metal transporter CNNM